MEATAKLAAPEGSEYVIITGVQIHGALGKNFFWPGSITHYADGVATDLNDDYNERVATYDLPTWLQAEAIAQAQQYAGKTRLNGFFSEFM